MRIQLLWGVLLLGAGRPAVSQQFMQIKSRTGDTIQLDDGSRVILRKNASLSILWDPYENKSLTLRGAARVDVGQRTAPLEVCLPGVGRILPPANSIIGWIPDPEDPKITVMKGIVQLFLRDSAFPLLPGQRYHVNDRWKETLSDIDFERESYLSEECFFTVSNAEAFFKQLRQRINFTVLEEKPDRLADAWTYSHAEEDAVNFVAVRLLKDGFFEVAAAGKLYKLRYQEAG